MWCCGRASVRGAAPGPALSAQVSSKAPPMTHEVSRLRPAPRIPAPSALHRALGCGACLGTVSLRPGCLPDSKMCARHDLRWLLQPTPRAGSWRGDPPFPTPLPSSYPQDLSVRALGRATLSPAHLAARSVDHQLGVLRKDRVVLVELDHLGLVLHLRHREHPSLTNAVVAPTRPTQILRLTNLKYTSKVNSTLDVSKCQLPRKTLGL